LDALTLSFLIAMTLLEILINKIQAQAPSKHQTALSLQFERQLGNDSSSSLGALLVSPAPNVSYHPAEARLQPQSCPYMAQF